MLSSLSRGNDSIDVTKRALQQEIEEKTRAIRETSTAIKHVQEDLLKSRQLAGVGEVAGRAAQSALNPLTALESRVQNALLSARAHAKDTGPREMGEIFQFWEAAFHSGG